MRTRLLSAVLLPPTMLAVTACVTSQSATYTYSGSAATYGCSPFTASIQHTAVGTPVLGTTFVVRVPESGGTCSYICDWNVLATGLSDTQFQGVALPWPSMLTLGMPVCGQLKVSLDVLQPIPFGLGTGGVASVSLFIPSSSALTGFTFHQQLLSIRYILGGANVFCFGRKGTGVVGS